MARLCDSPLLYIVWRPCNLNEYNKRMEGGRERRREQSGEERRSTPERITWLRVMEYQLSGMSGSNSFCSAKVS